MLSSSINQAITNIGNIVGIFKAYFVDSAEFDRVNDDDVFIQSVEPMGPLVVTSMEDNDDVQTPSSANYNYNDINEEFNVSYLSNIRIARVHAHIQHSHD